MWRGTLPWPVGELRIAAIYVAVRGCSALPDFLLALPYVLVELFAERDSPVPIGLEVDADVVHSCSLVQVLDSGLHHQWLDTLIDGMRSEKLEFYTGDLPAPDEDSELNSHWSMPSGQRRK